MLIVISFAYSQNQCKKGNIWYFGENAGLDFNSGSPVALTDGQMYTDEGCASIADEQGNLLFYTDGSTVYDKNHQVMANGTNLNGDMSSTQSGIIVTDPYDNNRHYVFSIGAYNSAGLYYSEVLFSAGGVGVVTSVKNIHLHLTANEKLTAVKHSNGEDVWLVSYEHSSNTYIAYLIDQTGVSTNPVISALPSDPNKTNQSFFSQHSLGYLKSSPDGHYLAAAHQNNHYIELLNFDNSSGSITYSKSVSTSFDYAYGLEFSSTGQFLYASKRSGSGISELWQFDLNEIDPAPNSIMLNQAGSTFTNQGGALQLAPDGKIYYTVKNSDYLHSISSPDEKGLNCDFILNALYLNGKKARIGLPNIMSSYIVMPEIECDFLCLGNETLFSCGDEDVTDVQWNFGDPNSGVLNEAVGANVMHVFSHAGSFNVSMTITKNGVTETIEKEITINPSPEINIDDQLYICNDPYVILDAYNEGATYEWSNETYESSIEASIAGNYSVTVTNEHGCLTNKEVEVFDGCDNNSVYLPSAFSPNGDGANDVLYVRGSQIETLDFSVYNRFGELVFNTKDQSIGWDGIYKGIAVNNEVFAANLFVTFSNGEQKHLQGDVTLVR